MTAVGIKVKFDVLGTRRWRCTASCARPLAIFVVVAIKPPVYSLVAVNRQCFTVCEGSWGCSTSAACDTPLLQAQLAAQPPARPRSQR